MQKSWLLITYQWNYLIEISRFLSNCLSKHKMKKKNWINFSVKVISIKTLQHTETPQWSCASNHLSGYCMRHDFSNLIRYLELFKQYTFTFVCSNKANLTVRFACSKRPIWQLTLSWRRPLSYKNQSIYLLSKSINWFLYYTGLRHERVKRNWEESLTDTTLNIKIREI